MNNSNNLWCPLPWSHVAVKSNGYLRVCSHSQSGGNKNTLLEHLRIDDLKDTDVLNCNTLKTIRKQIINNEWPEQCRRCKIEKESGKRSRNEWEATMYDFTKDDAERITLEDGTITEHKILSLDLRLGNKCNLQCVMCYPGESNQWLKIQEQITGSKVFLIDDITYTADYSDFTWSEQESYYRLLLEHSQYVKKIKFGGGEPFLAKQHVTLLEGLIANGLANDIEIEYSINVTVLPTYIFELFTKFKLVKLCASVDGVGAVNEAIRFPTKWNIIETNLDLLDNLPDNIAVFTSTTVSILNVEFLVEWMQWLKNKNFKKINKDTFTGMVSHPVMNPKYLNVGLMTEQQHARMFDYLDQITTDTDIKEKLSQWNMYAKSMPLTAAEILQGRQELADFFVKMSAVQNADWKLIFPKCYEMIQEWHD